MKSRSDISRRGFIGGAATLAAVPLLTAKTFATPKLAVAAAHAFPPAKGLPRSMHAAVALSNGHILVCGGYHENSADTNLLGATPSASVQLFDPRTGQWFDLAPMRTPRARHSALLMNDGRVVVAGGYYTFALNSVEIYDPASNKWFDGKPLSQPVCDHTATLIDNEMILIGGPTGSLVSRARIEAAPGQ